MVRKREMTMNKLAFPLTFALLLMFACPQAASAGEGATLEFWDTNSRAPHVVALDKLMKDFEKESGIKVKKTVIDNREQMKLAAAAKASGTLPDVMLIDFGGFDDISMGQMGVAAPVTEIIQEKGRSFWIQPDFITASSFSGQTWSVPMYAYPHILVYRKDWFDEKKLQPPKTWDQWYKAAAALTDPKADRWGVIFGFKEGFPFMDLVSSNGDYWWDKDGNPTIGERTRETIDFFRKMANDTMYPGSVNLTHEDTRLAFTKGLGAMLGTSTSYLFPFDRDVPKWFDEGRIAAAPFPVNSPGREGTYLAYATLVAVKGPREAMAKQFIRYIIRNDVAVKFFSNNLPGHIPALEEVYKDQSFWSARAKFRSTYEAGYKAVKESKWNEPVVPWGGVFRSRAHYSKVMDNIYVNKWSTDRVMAWLIDTMKDVKAEWK